MATDYILEAKNAMDKAANYGNQSRPNAMIAQAHFASAAALVAIAERLERIATRLETISCVDGGLGVTVLR